MYRISPFKMKGYNIRFTRHLQINATYITHILLKMLLIGPLSDFLNCDARLLTKGANVGWVCNHKKNETDCKIRCKEGEFETPTPEVFKCTPEGVWTPDTLPKCVLKEKSGEKILNDVLRKSKNLKHARTTAQARSVKFVLM